MAQHHGEGKYQSVGVGVIVSHEDGSKLTKEEVEAVSAVAEDMPVYHRVLKKCTYRL